MDPSTIYRELLAKSEARANELAAAVERLRRSEAEALGSQRAAHDEVGALRREVERLHAVIAQQTAALAIARAEVARLQHYPAAYPGFADAGRFFADALTARPPLAPFLALEAPFVLAPDVYAARYRAYLGRTPCTVRIARSADAREVWELETRQAIALALAPGTPGLATVVGVADESRPGFVVSLAFADAVKTVDELGRARDPESLTATLQRTLSLLRALEARELARCRASLPDACAVAVHGREVTLLEPTALHPGDLADDTLRGVHPTELRGLALAALQSAWVFGAAAMFRRLVLVPTHDLLAGIARAAQQAREPYPLETRLRLRDLIEGASSRDSRPTLEELRATIARALG